MILLSIWLEYDPHGPETALHVFYLGIPERPTVQRNLLQALMSGMGKVLAALLIAEAWNRDGCP